MGSVGMGEVATSCVSTLSSMPTPPVAENRWYVLHLKSGRTQSVIDQLELVGVEYYSPSCRSLRQWKDRKVWLESPLFPGYVFVKMLWSEKRKVVNLAGVICMLGTEASSVDVEILDHIRTASRMGVVSPSDGFEIGERVRVVRGPFEGLAGVLVSKGAEARLVVRLEPISKPFVLHTSVDHVELA